MSCPHCLNAGCIHCREIRLEATRRGLQQRSRLTHADRITLEILITPFHRDPPADRDLPRRRFARVTLGMLGNCVLPAGFALENWVQAPPAAGRGTVNP